MKRSFQRVSKRARWARRFALVALPAAILSVLGQRFGEVDTPTTLLSYTVSILLALVALGLGVGALPAIIGDRYRGGRDAVSAIVIGMIVLGPVMYAGYRFFDAPLMNDVTTAPTAPPAFDVVLSARPESANPLDYDSEDVALQRQYYPQVRPLFANMPSSDVFSVAEMLVTNRGWLILDVVEPTPGFEGRIEAVAQTLIFGFRDDVVITITGTGDGTRIDMRSASRYGEHDLGANAERIDSFLADLQWQLIALSQAIIQVPEEDDGAESQ